MNLYQDSTLVVADALTSLHERELASFGECGTWLSGEERAALAGHVRSARVQAGTQEDDAARADAAGDLLPDAMLELAGKLAVTPDAFEKADFNRARQSGMSDAEYAETVGVVSRLVNLDVFARGLGLPLRPLPEPDDGEPLCERPAGAVAEGAWLDTLPCAPAGGPAAEALYGKGMQPFIYRALSLVPDEARRVMAAGNVQYLTLDRFFDFGYSPFPALTRPQVEAVAGRVSALNGCFY